MRKLINLLNSSLHALQFLNDGRWKKICLYLWDPLVTVLLPRSIKSETKIPFSERQYSQEESHGSPWVQTPSVNSVCQLKATSRAGWHVTSQRSLTPPLSSRRSARIRTAFLKGAAKTSGFCHLLRANTVWGLRIVLTCAPCKLKHWSKAGCLNQPVCK